MHPTCDRCSLYKQCENFLIPGRGNFIDPLLILIGEAPGRSEDQEGKVFIGPAGEKLNSILKNRENDVYVTNCCKCSPYKNPFNRIEGVRPPTDFEIESCHLFLLKELKIFDSEKVILVPMGAVSYNSLFGFPPKNGISANVGRIQEAELEGRKFTVVPNFHPAYLLEGRHPEMEAKFVGVLEHAFDLVKNKREGKVIKESSEWEILNPQRAIQEFKRILEVKNTLEYIYIDLETPSYEIEEKESNSEIIMINFAHSLDYQGYSVPLKVTNQVHHLGYPYDVPEIGWNVSPEEATQIRKLFSQIIQEVPLAGHVLKFDLKCLLIQRWIPDLSRVQIFDDTCLLTHLVYNQRLGNLKLKDVCRKLFDIEDDWEKKVKEYMGRFRLKADRTFDKIPTGILGEYGALDAFYDKKLHIHLLEKMPEKLKHLRDVMNYLVIVYTEAELAGFPIDQSILDFLSSSYGEMLKGMVEKALTFEEVKNFIRDKTEELKVKHAKKRVQPTQEMLEEESFGMTKLKPLAAVIYGKKYFGMMVLKQTKGGKLGQNKSPSTDQEAVDLLLHNGSIKENQKKFIENLSDFRTISKLKSTYVDPVYAGLHNGIYFWDFIIPGTVTGRLGSGFHTLPHSSDIKNMYTSRYREQGGLICSADFSQLELRILAALSKEYKMIDAFIAGVDIHAKTASEIFHVPIDQVTDEQRQIAKVINFSIIYGKTAETLKDDLHCTKERAQEIIDSLLAGYDRVSEWIMSRYREVAANASVMTAFGREIPIPEWTYDSRVSHLEALRMSVNYPIQCLEKNTLIPLVSGEVKTIKELSDEGKEQYVYCYDLDSKNISVSKGTKFFKSGEVSELFCVHLDNGKSIKCTKEHLFLLRKGVYKSANDLIVGDSLMPFDVRVGRRGYKQVFDFQKIPGLRLWRSVYKLVAKKYLGERKKGENIHHIDLNKLNDIPENLEYLNPEDHIFLHSDRSIGKRNPFRKFYPSWHMNQAEAARFEVLKRLEVTGNVMGIDHEQFKNKLCQSWKETYAYRVKRLREAKLNPETTKRRSAAQKLKFNNPFVRFKYGKNLIEKFPMINFNTPENWDNSLKILILNKGVSGRSIKYSNFFLSHGSWKDFVSFLVQPTNHKIVKIEKIIFDKPEPVYDVEVPEFHNFALYSGIFVHNSAASDIVKSSIGRFCKKIKKMGMKTIFMGDTHDAIHNDLYPGELFDTIYLMKLTCENESQEMYRDWLICPIKIDVSLGVSIGNEIEFEIKEIEDNRILLVGEGTRRDFNLLMSVGSEAYQMNLSVEKESPIKPEEYSLDRIIRDKVKWEAKLEIKRK